MQMNELMGTIETLNAKVGTLNSQRLTDLGKKEALEKQLTTAVADYKSTYGVELTKDNIDSECSKVEADLIKQSNKLSKLISLIESGNYTEADELASSVEGVSPVDTADEPRDLASTMSADDLVEGSNVSTPSDNIHQAEVSQPVVTPQANVGTPQVSEPVPTAPNVGVTPNVAEPVAPSDPVPSAPTPPTGVNQTPNTGASPTQLSFSDILNGSDFK